MNIVMKILSKTDSGELENVINPLFAWTNGSSGQKYSYVK